jgi:hypothetical protein
MEIPNAFNGRGGLCMRRYLLYGAFAGALVLLGLRATVMPALAHGRGDREPRGVAGVVTSVDGQSLLVQTRTGSVAVTLTGSTHVIRRVSGSAADLSRGEVIDLQMSRGQSSVTTIHIYAAGTALPSRNPPRPLHAPRPTHPPHPGRTLASRPEHGPAQIVALTDTTITVRYADGRSATYTLGGNLTVLKDMVGQLTDVAMGQTVSVRFKNGSSTVADLITILRS